MPRFYFHLRSKDGPLISDTSGKELNSLNDAFEHARKLIDEILLHVGQDDAEACQVVILNDDRDGQMNCSIRRIRSNESSTPKIKRVASNAAAETAKLGVGLTHSIKKHLESHRSSLEADAGAARKLKWSASRLKNTV